MPRINREYHPATELFRTLRAAGNEMNEKKDCSVIAIAAATGRPYAEVHAIMEKHGRKARKPTPPPISEATLEELGFTIKDRKPSEFIERYPEVHKRALKSVTSHHPDRFPEVFKDGKTYIMISAKHMLCVKDGVNVDWSRGSALRARFIWEVAPKSSEVAQAACDEPVAPEVDPWTPFAEREPEVGERVLVWNPRARVNPAIIKYMGRPSSVENLKECDWMPCPTRSAK